MENFSQTQTIMQTLQNVPGLTIIDLLHEKHKSFIQQLEHKSNLGVLESLNRKHTLLVSHNSLFRDPVSPIVENKNNQITFPAVPFPEIHPLANNVVSSSPSNKVHEALQKTLNIKLPKNEATLLIGWD